MSEAKGGRDMKARKEKTYYNNVNLRKLSC